jgi:hypothetical protein
MLAQSQTFWSSAKAYVLRSRRGHNGCARRAIDIGKLSFFGGTVGQAVGARVIAGTISIRASGREFGLVQRSGEITAPRGWRVIRFRRGSVYALARLHIPKLRGPAPGREGLFGFSGSVLLVVSLLLLL